MISTSTLQTDFYGIQTEQNITFKMCLALNIFNKKSRSGGQGALETLWAARLRVIFVLCVGAHEAGLLNDGCYDDVAASAVCVCTCNLCGCCGMLYANVILNVSVFVPVSTGFINDVISVWIHGCLSCICEAVNIIPDACNIICDDVWGLHEWTMMNYNGLLWLPNAI